MLLSDLGTTDHAKALVKARTIYQEIKGKIQRGERLRSIATIKLIEIYLSSIFIADIPHAGVTPQTFKLKKYFLAKWLEFIASLKLQNTPIDRLPLETINTFASWFRDLPRKDGNV